MLHKTRHFISNDNRFFSDIEIDETFIESNEKNKLLQGNANEVVVESIQRDVYNNKKKLVNTQHIKNTKIKTLKSQAHQTIDSKANIIGGRFKSYKNLPHYKVNHNEGKIC